MRAEGFEDIFYSLQIDQLEERWGSDDANRLHWDLEGWVGGDTNRVWFRSEGDKNTSGPSGSDVEVQLLYSRHLYAFWDFQIGGYQVSEKWLKDRRGRTLTDEDIAHYGRIVIALRETIRIMGEIDAVIEEHGGWLGAFQSAEVGS